jgi:hypothetical protein
LQNCSFYQRNPQLKEQFCTVAAIAEQFETTLLSRSAARVVILPEKVANFSHLVNLSLTKLVLANDNERMLS